MSGAIQPFRKPAMLPRSTINMQGFDQTSLGQKALQQRQQMAAQPRPAQGASFYGDRSVGTPAAPNLAGRIQAGSPVSNNEQNQYAQGLLSRSLQPQQQLRQSGQAFSAIENRGAQRGGWVGMARNEMRSDPTVAAQMGAKMAAMVPQPERTMMPGNEALATRYPGGGSWAQRGLLSPPLPGGGLVEALQKGVPAQAGPRFSADDFAFFNRQGLEHKLPPTGLIPAPGQQVGRAPAQSAFQSVPGGMPNRADMIRQPMPAPLYGNTPSSGAHGVALNSANQYRLPSWSKGGGIAPFGSGRVRPSSPPDTLLAALQQGLPANPASGAGVTVGRGGVVAGLQMPFTAQDMARDAALGDQEQASRIAVNNAQAARLQAEAGLTPEAKMRMQMAINGNTRAQIQEASRNAQGPIMGEVPQGIFTGPDGKPLGLDQAYKNMVTAYPELANPKNVGNFPAAAAFGQEIRNNPSLLEELQNMRSEMDPSDPWYRLFGSSPGAGVAANKDAERNFWFAPGIGRRVANFFGGHWSQPPEAALAAMQSKSDLFNALMASVAPTPPPPQPLPPLMVRGR